MKVIHCGICGARQFFKDTAENVNNLIAFGWKVNGHGMICPSCVDAQIKLHNAMLINPRTIAEMIGDLSREVE